jgi:hypothetical protein
MMHCDETRTEIVSAAGGVTTQKETMSSAKRGPAPDEPTQSRARLSVAPIEDVAQIDADAEDAYDISGAFDEDRQSARSARAMQSDAPASAAAAAPAPAPAHPSSRHVIMHEEFESGGLSAADAARLELERMQQFVKSFTHGFATVDQMRDFFTKSGNQSVAKSMDMRWIMKVVNAQAARSVVESCRAMAEKSNVHMVVSIVEAGKCPQLVMRKWDSAKTSIFQGSFDVMVDVGSMARDDTIAFSLNITELHKALESSKDSDNVEIMCHRDGDGADVCILSGETLLESHHKFMDPDIDEDAEQRVPSMLPSGLIVRMDHTHRDFIRSSQSRSDTVSTLAIIHLESADGSKARDRLEMKDSSGNSICSLTSNCKPSSSKDHRDLHTDKSMIERSKHLFSIHLVAKIMRSMGKRSDAFGMVMPEDDGLIAINACTDDTKLVWLVGQVNSEDE